MGMRGVCPNITAHLVKKNFPFTCLTYAHSNRISCLPSHRPNASSPEAQSSPAKEAFNLKPGTDGSSIDESASEQTKLETFSPFATPTEATSKGQIPRVRHDAQ